MIQPFSHRLSLLFIGVISVLFSANVFAQLPTYQDLIINEVIADNKNSGLDYYGQSDDWIELYNPTSDTISLAGYFITDNANDRFKFQLPSGTLAPLSYTIIWADNETWQLGGIHANFSLSASGDAVFLFSPKGEFLDSVVFGYQHQDVSWGRCAAGDNQFTFMSPSPQYLNKTSCAVGLDELNSEAIKAYYNATQQQLVIESNERQSVDLFNSIGKLVAQFTTDESPFSTENFAPGLYIISLKNKQLKVIISPLH